jgi:hypothetical protein
MRIHNPRELQHDTSREPQFRGRTPVTVCVATIFRWNYAEKGKPRDLGWAALVATDRMITTGDIQYEPFQLKIGSMTTTTLVAVSGDYGIHSEAFRETQKQTNNASSPTIIAKIYAQQIQKIKRREAEDLFLAPLGLNTDTFLAQQDEMSDRVVSVLTEQLQGHKGEEVEALIVGTEIVRDTPAMRLFSIDTHGIITSCDDIGFAAIGGGAWHARSSIMQSRYINATTFAPALALTFAAKKAAEIAPGVGKETDLTIVLRHEIIATGAEIVEKLKEIHGHYIEKRTALGTDAIAQMQEFLDKPSQQLDLGDKNAGTREIPGGDAQTNERLSSQRTKTTRKDEAGT